MAMARYMFRFMEDHHVKALLVACNTISLSLIHILVSDLTTETPDEENGAERMADVLDAYVGVLGVDGRNRKLYILDGDGVCLVAPEGENQVLEYTKNLNFALNTGLETNEVGDESNLAADYMDLAVPIHRGDEGYVI